MSSNDGILRLSVADYAVFVILLAVSAAVGFFFAYRDRKKKESGNYLLGDRKMSWWSAGISCSLSFFAGSTMIGFPAEIMYRGSSYVWMILGYAMSIVIGCEVFLPIYYKNGMSTAIEYCGSRFGTSTRYAATLIYILQTIAYSGVMIYAPALAFDAVSDLSLVTAVLSIGIICTIYTTLGGLKAVIWTDVIQFTVIIAVLTVTVFGTADKVGGFIQSVRIAWEGDRIDFNHFEFDPRYRLTFWSTTYGLGIMWTSVQATNQAVVQRFLCCRSIKEGKKALYLSVLMSPFSIAFCLPFTGYVLYAYFADCDPIASGRIAAEDQALPYMILNVFSDTPGVSGLFIAGVFAGALSTVSSTLNALTSVTVGDIIRPNVNWSDETLLWISRGLTFMYGGLCIGFAFLASALGSIIQASLSVLGLCAGALLGPIAMGVLFPLANEKGAIAGMISALSFNIWLFAGAWMYPPPLKFLHLKSRSVVGCGVANNTNLNMSVLLTTEALINEHSTEYSTIQNTTSPISASRPAIADFYAVSFCYYAPLGLAVCLIVGLMVSVLTGGLKSRHKVDPKLICLPFEHSLLRWLPTSFRTFMIPKMGDATQTTDEDNKEDAVCKKSFDVYETSYAMANKVFNDDSETISTYL